MRDVRLFGYNQGVAADLQIPAALQDLIEDWIGEFKNNFLDLGDRPVDQPVWRDGSDIAGEMQTGVWGALILSPVQERVDEHVSHAVHAVGSRIVVRWARSRRPQSTSMWARVRGV